MTKTFFGGLGALGIGLVAWSTLFSGAQFGMNDGIVLMLSGLLFAGALLPMRWRVTKHFISTGLVVFSLVVAIVTVELMLWLIEPVAPKKPAEFRTFVPALYDEQVGYVLKPNQQVQFDDGFARGTVTTNSLGHRDREPERLSGRCLVNLIGDSFTFGNLLDDTETIDAQLESMSDGTVDAQNMGVGGYGPPQILEVLMRSKSVDSDFVVYLFYLNDLRNDAMEVASRVFKGHVVPSMNAKGEKYTDAELQRQLDRVDENRFSVVRFVSETLELLRVRNLVWRATNPDLAMLGQLPEWYNDDNVVKAVDYVVRMKTAALSKDSEFLVLVIPSMDETIAQAYSTYTKRFIEALAERSIKAVQLIEHVEPSHYWQHDGHFNRDGAAAAATVLWDVLSDRCAE